MTRKTQPLISRCSEHSRKEIQSGAPEVVGEWHRLQSGSFCSQNDAYHYTVFLWVSLSRPIEEPKNLASLWLPYQMIPWLSTSASVYSKWKLKSLSNKRVSTVAGTWWCWELLSRTCTQAVKAYSVALYSEARIELITLMTEQPSLGTVLLTPHREGSRKGDPQKVCHPSSAPMPQLWHTAPMPQLWHTARKTRKNQLPSHSTISTTSFLFFV